MMLAKLSEGGTIDSIESIRPIAELIPYTTLMELLNGYRQCVSTEYWNTLEANGTGDVIIDIAIMEMKYCNEEGTRDISDIASKIYNKLINASDDVFMYMIRSDSYALRVMLFNTCNISMSDLFNRMISSSVIDVINRYNIEGASVIMDKYDGKMYNILSVTMEALMENMNSMAMYFGDGVGGHMYNSFRISLLSTISSIPICNELMYCMIDYLNMNKDNVSYEYNDVFGIDYIDYVIGGSQYVGDIVDCGTYMMDSDIRVKLRKEYSPLSEVSIKRDGSVRCEYISLSSLNSDSFISMYNGKATVVNKMTRIVDGILVDVIDPLNRLMSGRSDTLTKVDIYRLMSVDIFKDDVKVLDMNEINNIINEEYLRGVPSTEKLIVASYAHATSNTKAF